MSAMSLVNIIRKARGDDIAGAASDLERIAGFPNSVAKRIASGELSMDPADVAARQDAAAGFDELYHGSTHDIRRFDGSRANADGDSGRGTYLTDSAHDASINYAGEGPDLTARLENHAEENSFQDFVGANDTRTIGNKEFTRDEWEALDHGEQMDYLITDARYEIKGGNEGVMYPLQVLREAKLARYEDDVPTPEAIDYIDEAADSLSYSYPNETKKSLLNPDGELYDEVMDEAYSLAYNDEDSIFGNVRDVINRYENMGSNLVSDLQTETLDGSRMTWGDVRARIDDEIANGRLWADDGDGNNISSGGLLSEILEEAGFDGVVDTDSWKRFDHMEAGEHTIMFPGREHLLRSPNAAFDPQYRGKNIMGEATVPLLGLLSTGTAGAGLLLKSLFAEAEEAKR